MISGRLRMLNTAFLLCEAAFRLICQPSGASGRCATARPRLAGDVAKARRAYQDFPSLWKDADSDLPIAKLN